MITSKRSQLGQLLEDRPDMIIHNSWNHRDKSQSIQEKELEASTGLAKYAKLKDKWFLFISTSVESTDSNKFYVIAKQAVESYVNVNLEKYMIVRLPTLLAEGTVFHKFYTGEYKHIKGKVIRFGLLEDAAQFVNYFIANPHKGFFEFYDMEREKMLSVSDKIIKELADFYRGLCIVPNMGYHDVEKFYKE